MIEVTNLSKHYGANKAVDDISFSIKEGEIVAFLGPNGAGKSTTMNMLTGYISSTSGSIKIDGHDVVNSPKEAKKRIGYLPEQPPLYLDMTLDEYLDFVYDLKGATQPKKSHIEEIKALTNLSHMGSRLLRNFSKGYRQRAGLAQALIGDPSVLILDEPTIGLDPTQIIEFRNVIAGLGKTTILSTHILSEASALCTRLIIINQGKLIAEGDRDQLAGANEFRYTVQVSAAAEQAKNAIVNVHGILEVSVLEEKETTLLLLCDRDVRLELTRALCESNITLYTLKKATPTLEEIFLNAVSGTGEEATK